MVKRPGSGPREALAEPGTIMTVSDLTVVNVAIPVIQAAFERAGYVAYPRDERIADPRACRV